MLPTPKSLNAISFEKENGCTGEVEDSVISKVLEKMKQEPEAEYLRVFNKNIMFYEVLLFIFSL